MQSLLGPVLAIAGVAVSVLALLLIGFFHEAGRKRLLPLLRPLMKHLINPKTLRAIARGESNYAVVHHLGRRTGRGYQTPVEAYRMAEGALILLPYGPVTDWCRNVLTAGQCMVTLDGEDIALRAPEGRFRQLRRGASAERRRAALASAGHSPLPVAEERHAG